MVKVKGESLDALAVVLVLATAVAGFALFTHTQPRLTTVFTAYASPVQSIITNAVMTLLIIASTATVLDAALMGALLILPHLRFMIER